MLHTRIGLPLFVCFGANRQVFICFGQTKKHALPSSPAMEPAEAELMAACMLAMQQHANIKARLPCANARLHCNCRSFVTLVPDRTACKQICSLTVPPSSHCRSHNFRSHAESRACGAADAESGKILTPMLRHVPAIDLHKDSRGTNGVSFCLTCAISYTFFAEIWAAVA